MSIRNHLSKLKKAIHSFVQTYKFGGINEVKVGLIKYDNLLDGKRILVTGGGSGIGLAIAKKYAELGAEVLITGRNYGKLQTAAQQINNEKLHCLEWDITDSKIISKKLQEAQNILGGTIDILVNNAGVQPKEFFPNVSENEWEKIYNTNSKGTFFLSQEICKLWQETETNNCRKIINISSQGGFVGATYPYRMTKWDICGLTQGLALRMAQHNVLVNGIAPGVVKTEMQSFSLKQGNNTFCNQNPLNRVSLPEEIAELAMFMASDACNFMTGQTILIDGGYSLK